MPGGGGEGAEGAGKWGASEPLACCRLRGERCCGDRDGVSPFESWALGEPPGALPGGCGSVTPPVGFCRGLGQAPLVSGHCP